MKAIILAGGIGSRLSEETQVKPKPMVEVGGMPILWHIMKIYSHYGITEFVVCCGYKGYLIKEYFANYFLHTSNVTFDMAENSVEIHENKAEPWRVTLLDTGDEASTGWRLRQAIEFCVQDQEFCFTYGDGVGDIDVPSLIALHRQHGRSATVTATRPPARYGALEFGSDNDVVKFEEKPRGDGSWINGGFFVINRNVAELIDSKETSWEGDALVRLAKTSELSVYRHYGFWHPMDTLRDKNFLNELWNGGRAPWNVWG